jgi:hypothetical protein
VGAKAQPEVLFPTSGRNATCEMACLDASNLQSPLRGASNIALIGLIIPPATPVAYDFKKRCILQP